MDTIRTFQGRNAFLSNFFIEADGKTVEHRFQAAKTHDAADQEWIMAAEKPGQAKYRGSKRAKRITLRDDWDTARIGVMTELLRAKFQDPTLRAALDATGNAILEEGNIWNDTFWGISLKTGKGENNLGKILMAIREENRGA